jgi:hypothetical protein
MGLHAVGNKQVFNMGGLEGDTLCEAPGDLAQRWLLGR